MVVVVVVEGNGIFEWNKRVITMIMHIWPTDRSI